MKTTKGKENPRREHEKSKRRSGGRRPRRRRRVIEREKQASRRREVEQGEWNSETKTATTTASKSFQPVKST